MAAPTDLLRAYEARKRPRAPFVLRPGYEIRVHTRLKEGEKERVQVFEGIVTAITGAGLGKTFTVRRVVSGVGVERIFPLFSPLVTDVEVVRATKVRRARLTYLRKTEAKKRRKEDAGLMRRVEAEREAARRAKEEIERKKREERAAALRETAGQAEKAANAAEEKKESTETKTPTESPKAEPAVP